VGRWWPRRSIADTIVQQVTDTATELTDAEFGAFFYNVHDRRGDAYMLYTLSGAPEGRRSPAFRSRARRRSSAHVPRRGHGPARTT
jgi:hypothetical protein